MPASSLPKIQEVARQNICELAQSSSPRAHLERQLVLLRSPRKETRTGCTKGGRWKRDAKTQIKRIENQQTQQQIKTNIAKVFLFSCSSLGFKEETGWFLLLLYLQGCMATQMELGKGPLLSSIGSPISHQ